MSGLRFPFPAEAAMLTVDVLVQLTLVTLAALLVARTVARRQPAVRYVVLLGALLCILASPAFASVPERTAGFPPAPPGSGLTGCVAVLFIVWAAGALGGLIRLLRGRRTAARLRREARPLVASGCGAVLAAVAGALGTARLPRLAVSPTVRGPVALGPGAPLVLLPEGLVERLAPEQLRDVLIHECAHVSQRHHLVGLLQQLAAALYWPHPLVHLLNRELSRAREEVCDNFALRASSAPEYARTLLALAERAGGERGSSGADEWTSGRVGVRQSAAPPFVPSSPRRMCSSGFRTAIPSRKSRSSELEARVVALLDPRRQRATRPGPLVAALLATLLLASAITGAGMRAGEAAVLSRPPVPRSDR